MNPTSTAADRNGFSLVSVIIGIAIMGIMTLIMASTFKNNLKVISMVERRGEMEDLRQYVRVLLDCETTVKNLGKTCGTEKIALYSHTRAFVPKNSDRKIGKYSVYALCRGTTEKHLNIFAKRDGDDRYTEVFDWDLAPTCKK